MAVTNRDRVGSAMDALKAGLVPFVSREFINRHKGNSSTLLQQVLGEPVARRQGAFYRYGRRRAPAGHVGVLERGLPRHPGVC